MINIEFDIDSSGLARGRANLEALPNSFINSVLARTAANLKQNAPADTGQLARSGRHQMTGPGEGEIIFDTNYAKFVHDGRGAGGVNVFAIIDWARSKGLPESAAWPIAKSIAKKGTIRQPWANNFVESIKMRQIVTAELRRVANNVA